MKVIELQELQRTRGSERAQTSPAF